MSFTVSPGITVTENDLTTIVPAVDTSPAAFAGVFHWGPIGQKVLVTSETDLVSSFGKPSNLNAEGWFAAASFLAYSGNLFVSRAANTSSSNSQLSVLTAVANTAAVSNLALCVVKNDDDYATKDGNFDANANYLARYPGSLGNSLKISQVDTADQFKSDIDMVTFGSGAELTISVGSNTATVTINATSNTLADNAAVGFTSALSVTDQLRIGNGQIGTQYMKVTAITYDPISGLTGDANGGVATLSISFEDPLKLHSNATMTDTVSRYWEYWDVVTNAPGQSAFQLYSSNAAANDELHVVVVDAGGKFTGVPGTVLEVFEGLSRATDAKDSSNLSSYYKNVINKTSRYVWFANDRADAPSATASQLTNSTETAPMVIRMKGGADGPDESTVPIADLANAYDLFASADTSDIGLIVSGKARGEGTASQLANYLIDNIAEVRKDCVVFVSPDAADVVNNAGNEVDDVIDFANTLRDSSYGFCDSGYKYMYDRYNDVYRYIPLNGDMAGLAARTDATNDAWWSPAGFNRGQIKNLVRLSWNPGKQAQRDLLYKARVNPVVSFDGMGTVLFGDKTLLAKPSAFSRINVRRLFIVLEKAISSAAKYSLFEFNDQFTRTAFANMVSPYLKDIKGRRGITDFKVICDSTNNPGSIIDAEQFVGDIYIKPARAINFIQLNFTAVGTDVSFSEVVNPS